MSYYTVYDDRYGRTLRNVYYPYGARAHRGNNGNDETQQTAIREEENTQRAEIEANEKIQLKSLDLKTQEVANTREERMEQKAREREERMAQKEQQREDRMAQKQLDRDVRMADKEAKMAQIASDKEIKLQPGKIREKEIDTMKEMFEIDGSNKLKAYTMDHQERMAIIEIKGQLSLGALNKKGSKNYALSGSTFKPPSVKFNPMQGKANPSAVTGNQLCIMGPVDGSNVTGLPLALRHNESVFQEDFDCNSNDFDLTFDENIFSLEANHELKITEMKMNGQIEMARINKKDDKEMAYELKMKQMEMEMMKLQASLRN